MVCRQGFCGFRLKFWILRPLLLTGVSAARSNAYLDASDFVCCVFGEERRGHDEKQSKNAVCLHRASIYIFLFSSVKTRLFIHIRCESICETSTMTSRQRTETSMTLYCLKLSLVFWCFPFDFLLFRLSAPQLFHFKIRFYGNLLQFLFLLEIY